MGLPDVIYLSSMGEEDGAIDVAPDRVLHVKLLFIFFFFSKFLILFLPYFLFGIGRHLHFPHS